MKALVTILVLAGLAGGGYVILSQQNGVDVDVPKISGPNGGQLANGGGDGAGGTLTVKDPPKQAPRITRDREQERRALWEKLRPMSERFLPDPDNIGPCPPASSGARAAPVVRRYMDPGNGARVWEHDDGSYTQLVFGVGEVKDPRTGQMVPKELIVTQVPTKPVDIAPDELPVVDTTKPGK